MNRTFLFHSVPSGCQTGGPNRPACSPKLPNGSCALWSTTQGDRSFPNAVFSELDPDVCRGCVTSSSDVPSRREIFHTSEIMFIFIITDHILLWCLENIGPIWPEPLMSRWNKNTKLSPYIWSSSTGGTKQTTASFTKCCFGFSTCPPSTTWLKAWLAWNIISAAHNSGDSELNQRPTAAYW